MGFLKRIEQISTRTVHPIEHDLGLGDGVETFYFRDFDYEARQNIFTARANEKGLLDVRGAALFVGAEIVGNSLCTESGDLVTTAQLVKGWDPEVVDALSNLALKALAKTDAEKSENPSPAVS